MRMLTASTGQSGVAAARRHLPDVILMDINLPGINGIQAMKILQDDPTTSHIPVLAISANAMLSDIATGLEAGFMTYLTKPIHVKTFLAAIDLALEAVEERERGPHAKVKIT